MTEFITVIWKPELHFESGSQSLTITSFLCQGVFYNYVCNLKIIGDYYDNQRIVKNRPTHHLTKLQRLK